MTLNLLDGSHREYMKPGQVINYVHVPHLPLFVSLERGDRQGVLETEKVLSGL